MQTYFKDSYLIYILVDVNSFLGLLLVGEYGPSLKLSLVYGLGPLCNSVYTLTLKEFVS